MVLRFLGSLSLIILLIGCDRPQGLTSDLVASDPEVRDEATSLLRHLQTMSPQSSFDLIVTQTDVSSYRIRGSKTRHGSLQFEVDVSMQPRSKNSPWTSWHLARIVRWSAITVESLLTVSDSESVGIWIEHDLTENIKSEVAFAQWVSKISQTFVKDSVPLVLPDHTSIRLDLSSDSFPVDDRSVRLGYELRKNAPEKGRFETDSVLFKGLLEGAHP